MMRQQRTDLAAECRDLWREEAGILRICRCRLRTSHGLIIP